MPRKLAQGDSNSGSTEHSSEATGRTVWGWTVRTAPLHAVSSVHGRACVRPPSPLREGLSCRPHDAHSRGRRAFTLTWLWDHILPPHPRPCLHLSKCGSALRHGRWGGLAGFEVSPRTVESVLGARPVVPPPLLKGSGCRGRDTTPAQLVAPQYHLGVTQGTALRPSAPLTFCHGCAYRLPYL